MVVLEVMQTVNSELRVTKVLVSHSKRVLFGHEINTGE